MVVFLSIPSAGRNLMYYPKCASFDTLYNRFLVSCASGGRIIEVDENGQQKVFKSGLGVIISNHIISDLIYVTRDKGLYAINLHTGVIEKNISIPVAQFLTGLHPDTSGNLYIADNTANGRIFKLNLADDSYSVFCSGLASNPQDIEFDEENNRLVVIGYSASAHIQTVRLPVPVVTNIPTVSCGPYDGVARDRDGNYYFSCYEAGKIFRYDKDLANPVELMTDLPGLPSNIDINAKNNILSIPYIESHVMAFIGLDADLVADTTWAYDSLAVNFQGVSYTGADNWRWDFGDGDTATGQMVQHTYRIPGMYDVAVYGQVGDSIYHTTRHSFISVLADTINTRDLEGLRGETIEVIINAENIVPLTKMIVPITYAGSLGLQFADYSVTGCRTEYLDLISLTSYDAGNSRMTFVFENISYTEPDIAAGSGPIIKLYFTIPAGATLEQSATISFDPYNTYSPTFSGNGITYRPILAPGTISVPYICGDVNRNSQIDLLDLSYIISNIYRGGPQPEPLFSADVNGDGKINLLDVSYIINYLYRQGSSPNCPSA
jgi:hypothetical protein